MITLKMYQLDIFIVSVPHFLISSLVSTASFSTLRYLSGELLNLNLSNPFITNFDLIVFPFYNKLVTF